MMEKVLVTGASGYIASHIVHQLLSARNEDGSPRYEVRGTVRISSLEKKTPLLMEMAGKIDDGAAARLEVVGADLHSDEGWQSAVDGCTYVQHTASPLPTSVPQDPEELSRPAVGGVERVLKACQQAKTVKRVVMTSSAAAIAGSGNPSMGDKPADHVFSEEDWATPELCPPYERSKTLAERRAWEMWRDTPEEGRFELVVINPVMVMGPLVMSNAGASLMPVTKTMSGEFPMYPNVYYPMVDVRDVGRIHLAAMTKPGISGNRYLACAEELPEHGFPEIAQILYDHFSPRGFNFSTRVMPNWLVFPLKFIITELKFVAQHVGVKTRQNISKAVKEFDLTYIHPLQSILDAGESCIEFGAVTLPANYQPPTTAAGAADSAAAGAASPSTASDGGSTTATAEVQAAMAATETTPASDVDAEAPSTDADSAPAEPSDDTPATSQNDE
ncbi:uncharacterized protein LOC135827817 [Sycon ciliatum]|uniref:uncharacterized protein LOC135827817 n=1 Tax=Sycon ciliatum TaxID=27933 RepID=UPI0031F6BA50